MKNFATIMKEGIGHIIDLTPIGEKRKGGKIDKQALENNENGVYKNKIYTFFSYKEYFLQ